MTSTIFSDNFDSGFTDENGLPARDPDKWSSWTNGIELIEDDGSSEFMDPEGQLGAGFAGTDGYGLVFRAGGGAVRQATTTSLSTITRGGTISFSMIFGDDTNGGEVPDQLLGQSEGIFLSYSIDGGNNYTDIAHYLTTKDFDTSTAPDVAYPSGATPSSYTSTPVTWTTFTVPIPTLAVGESDVRFKWQQKKYSTTRDHYDSWGLDDVVITLADEESRPEPNTYKYDFEKPHFEVTASMARRLHAMGQDKGTLASAGIRLIEMKDQTWTRRGARFTSPNSRNLLGRSDTRDWLLPHSQSHVYAGRAGSDLIQAGASDDIIRAGKGDDIIFGGKGNDTIYTGMGNDLITTGHGSQEHIVLGSGHKVITDLTPGKDLLFLRNVSSFSRSVTRNGTLFEYEGGSVHCLGTREAFISGFYLDQIDNIFS